MSGSRILALWGWRSIRREARQHLLVAVLLAVLTAATTLSTFGFWLADRRPAPAPDAATHVLFFEQLSSAASVERAAADARRELGAARLVRQSPHIRPTGAASAIPLSDRPLADRLLGPPYRVLEGRPAVRDGELSVTTASVQALRDVLATDVRVGAEIVLGDRRLTVVGIVEDPENYDAYGFFVAPGSLREVASAELWVRGSEASVQRFAATQDESYVMPASLPVDSPLANLGLAASLLGLMLTGLLATVGYSLASQRRLRDFGLVAAVGARPAQVGGAVIAAALVVGTLGAGLGAIAGTAVAVGADRPIELMLRRDVAGSEAPLWLALPGFVLALAVSALAAWWPARRLGRMAIVDALAARRPQPSRARSWAKAATVLAALTVAVAVLGSSEQGGGVELSLVPLLGLAAVLLWSRTLIGLLSAVSARGPLALRIAGRDLARHTRRSAAAVMALIAVLAVSTSVATVAASSNERQRDAPPVIPPNMILLEDGVVGSTGAIPVHPPVRDAQRALAEIRAAIPGARTVPVYSAVDPRAPVLKEFGPARPAYPTVQAEQARSSRRGAISRWPTWVATPQLLSALGADARLASTDADALATHPAAVRLQPYEEKAAEQRRARSLTVKLPSAESIPGILVTRRGLQRRGWRERPCCWLVVAPRPIERAQHGAIYAAAGSRLGAIVPLRAEVPADARRLSALAGALLGILVVLLVLGLTRVESAHDLRVLRELGASPRVGGATGASQSLLLVLPAGLAATALGYLSWWAVRTASIEPYPLAVSIESVAMVAGLSIAAAGLGWLANARALSRMGVRRNE